MGASSAELLRCSFRFYESCAGTGRSLGRLIHAGIVSLAAGPTARVGASLQPSAFAGVERLNEMAEFPGDQVLIACIRAEILMVAKLEKVSDTA